MFTIEDIRNIAVQIEKNGENAYRQAAQATPHPEIAEMLNWMAGQEAKHASWFEQFNSSVSLSAEQQQMVDVGKDLLQEMVKDQTFSLDKNELENHTSVQELLQQFITFEEDTALFYDFIRGLIEDDETLVQLERIIKEENNHARKLQEILASMTPEKDPA